ncbi:universal stress protein [Clavibacter sp. Sh2088]|uniref:universal stress protein n=1 Tax=Clavibacter sp. Sh2088 TaxID=3397676 RepID=UPI0039E05BE2
MTSPATSPADAPRPGPRPVRPVVDPTAEPVPAAQQPAIPAGSVVVGHDGSAAAQAALDQALELAAALAAPVVVVRTWSIDTAPPGAVFHDGFAASFAEIGETVEERLRADTASSARRHPELDVHLRSVLSQPAETLIALSHDARMLVVGSRGLGGFAGMLLGSVSDRCVRHARCPVLVVPRTRDPRG